MRTLLSNTIGRCCLPAAVLLGVVLSAAGVTAAETPVDLREPAASQEHVSELEDATGSQSIDDVASHLKQSLTSEAFDSFDLFVYVDKAATGPFAQHMYVFQKNDQGGLGLLYDWPVSTGRDATETDAHGHLQSTYTPRGFYELDADRLYEDHTSGQWDEPMPYAMFFNWKPNGHKTGLAIHGTGNEGETELGKPASAGCVRLSLENAHTLFDLIRTKFRSPATPQLAYLDGGTDTSSEGLLLHDSDGRLQTADGYSVIVAIDNYDGESRVGSLF